MMATLRDITRYLVYSYETLTQSQITNSELTLHKLLYFAQKESLAFNGQPLFLESFEGWKHGPVLTELRFFFDEDFENMIPEETERLTDRERYIIDNVVVQYENTPPGPCGTLPQRKCLDQKPGRLER
ncbi:Panacea domain-containing protein [Acetobacterium sp.]|uniref:Panacea domain-containing protein n=1 Tax=Acetobacterium sp. TaxID=1872094 RepID=UPI00359447B3